MIKLMDDYEAYIDPIIDEYFDDYKFYLEFNSEWLRNNLPPDTQLEDLWELRAGVEYPVPTIYLYIKADGTTDRNRFEKMVEEFSVKNIRCDGRIVYYYDDERYAKLTNDWNTNVTPLDFDNIDSYIIYDQNNYKIYK